MFGEHCIVYTRFGYEFQTKILNRLTTRAEEIETPQILQAWQIVGS